jgi:hypothetical protein
MPSPLDDHAGLIASALAAISGGIILWWRSWMRVRSDLRDDHADERAKAGADLVDRTYREIIDRLNQRIDQMHASIENLNRDFGLERQARLAAETRAALCESRELALSARITVLEAKLK